MAKSKLILILSFFSILFLLVTLNKVVYANSELDQWIDSKKTYKDLINEGYEVKGYNISSIDTISGYKILLFVTVLQKDLNVYECQEYQTLDESMDTIDMSFVCRELVQPYSQGLGT
tara:strand:+ start:362 stop:712 length:351 start_codon:yes stop_codon:yes gene_type:complete